MVDYPDIIGIVMHGEQELCEDILKFQLFKYGKICIKTEK